MEDVFHFIRSPVWEELESEKGAVTVAGIVGTGMRHHPIGAAGGHVTGDESSDSEGEHEGPQKLIRKVSTSGQIRSKTSVKEGLLLKQTSSFQRWKKRYFKLREGHYIMPRMQSLSFLMKLICQMPASLSQAQKCQQQLHG
ncbi:diacylglycerol kinase eta-like isoform X2, partial [Acipenser oxyrinchus oxyrinchus]